MCIIICNFFLHRFVYFVPFIYSLIYLYHNGPVNIFYIVSYNLMLLYFLVQVIPVLTTAQLFQALPVGSYILLTHTFSMIWICFWTFSCFLALQDSSSSSSIFLAPVLESISPKNLGFYCLENGIRNH